MNLNDYLIQNYGKYQLFQEEDENHITLEGISFAEFIKINEHNVEEFKNILKDIRKNDFNSFLTNFIFYTVDKNDFKPEYITINCEEVDISTKTYFKAKYIENKFVFEPHSNKEDYEEYKNDFDYDVMNEQDRLMNEKLAEIYKSWYEIFTTKPLFEIVHFCDIYIYKDYEYGMFPTIILMFKNLELLVTSDDIYEDYSS